jgi:hypothetical protein
MSFAPQWVFDNAETMTINKNPIISQSITRDQSVRTVSRGGAVWRFNIKLPDAFKYSDIRYYINELELNAKMTTSQIQLSNPGYNYIVAYRGDLTPTQQSNLTIKYTSAMAAIDKTKFEVSGLPAIGGNITATTAIFRIGDIIQKAGSKYVYTVNSDVLRGTGTAVAVPVHRVILDAASDTATAVNIGSACTWTVICTQMPNWKIVSYDRVEWDGEFQFYESLL